MVQTEVIKECINGWSELHEGRMSARKRKTRKKEKVEGCRYMLNEVEERKKGEGGGSVGRVRLVCMSSVRTSRLEVG